MATTRACGCGGCSACDVRGERWCLRLRNNWRGWGLWSCLAALGSCTCLASTSAPPDLGLPSTAQQGVPFQQVPEITLEKLMEAIIPLIEHQLDRLDPSTATSSSSATAPAPVSQSLSNMVAQWEDKKEMCTSFIDSLPRQLTDEVAGNGRSLFMPLLSNALGGLGGVHWLGVGFLFISWSLDNISNVIQNREDCIGNLRRSLCLLQKTQQIWQATSNIHDATREKVLRDSVETAVRCATFCTSKLEDAWILRCLKATVVKDAVDTIAKELDRAYQENIDFMLRYDLQTKFERQITYPFRDDDLVGGQKLMQDAVTYLKSNSADIMAICLHGMGGIGKSTLGLKIFAEFQKSMYRDCRVELQFETNERELCDVQKQILEKVCKHAASKFSNITEGRCYIERELKQINDPIFLYVDNVLDHQYRSDLLPKAAFLPKGSRILITSRGDHIGRGISGLGITHYELIEVRKLQKQQAQLLWEQFKNKGEHRDISGVESLERRVLELCDGLPLVLIVVGKYIAYDNGVEMVEVWRQVVDDMEKAEPFGGSEKDELYSRIIFSIQKLDQNVKRAFLDMIFFNGSDHDPWVPVTWEDIERLVSTKYLQVLCHRALVRKSRESSFYCGRTISTAEIHDVMKAIGKRMVENDEQELRIAGMKTMP